MNNFFKPYNSSHGMGTVEYTDYTNLLVKWVECLPMARKTGVESLFESYQRHKTWYLIPSCLTLSIIWHVSRVKWSNPGK